MFIYLKCYEAVDYLVQNLLNEAKKKYKIRKFFKQLPQISSKLVLEAISKVVVKKLMLTKYNVARKVALLILMTNSLKFSQVFH